MYLLIFLNLLIFFILIVFQKILSTLSIYICSCVAEGMKCMPVCEIIKPILYFVCFIVVLKEAAHMYSPLFSFVHAFFWDSSAVSISIPHLC